MSNILPSQQEIFIKWQGFYWKVICLSLLTIGQFFTLPYAIYLGIQTFLLWLFLIIISIIALISLIRKQTSRSIILLENQLLYFNRRLGKPIKSFSVIKLDSIQTSGHGVRIIVKDSSFTINNVARASKIARILREKVGLR